MKPAESEIVKGTDQNGQSFNEGMVIDSSADESRIRLQDGSETVASHDKIKGQMN